MQALRALTFSAAKAADAAAIVAKMAATAPAIVLARLCQAPPSPPPSPPPPARRGVSHPPTLPYPSPSPPPPSLLTRQMIVSLLNELFSLLDVEVANEAAVLKRFANDKDVKPTPDTEYKFVAQAPANLKLRPIVIGAGPCGIFAALILVLLVKPGGILGKAVVEKV